MAKRSRERYRPEEAAAGELVPEASAASASAQNAALTALHLPAGVHLSNVEVSRALGAATGEAQERAADRVADAIPDTEPVPAAALRPTGTSRAPTAQGGEPLTAETLDYFQPRLGHDLSQVRVHRDEDSAGQASVLQARAFTVGSDIYVGRGEPGPGTPDGRHLLGHELTHVVQQSAGLGVQRQEVPTGLQNTPDYRRMSAEEIEQRHLWILQVLAQFDSSTPETALLEKQIADIGAELSRRAALAAGRTFSDEAIERAKTYFVENAKTEKDSCIVTLNKGLKLVTGEPALPTTSESIEKTMAKIAASGHTGTPKEIYFRAKNGKVNHGSLRPETLDESVWDAVLQLSGGDAGWSVFTMSLLDGDHSVTLSLEASNPSAPLVYWSDQWQSKAGWKPYNRGELDAEVTRLIQGWWDKQQEGHKFTTVVRLWRVTANSGARP